MFRAHLVRLVIAAAALAAAAGIGAPAASAGWHDSSCTYTGLTYSDGYNTWWSQEGVGLVGWRVSVTDRAWDRCDHGSLSAAVSIYTGNITAKGGKVHFIVYYKTTYQRNWTTSLIQYQGVGGSWWGVYSWSVDNAGNIGLTRTGRITDIRVSSWLEFDGVVGAARHLSCNMVNRTCDSGFGM